MYTIESEKRVRGDLVIKFELVDDEFSSPFDDDIVGRFSDTWVEGAIDRYPTDFPRRGYQRYEDRYYIPSQDVDELVEYYQKNGESKGPARLRALRAIDEELQLAEEYLNGNRYYAGMIVKVYWKGKKWGEDSLWGLDLSVYNSRNEDYLRETTIDVLAQAIRSARSAAAKSMDADASFRFISLDHAMQHLLQQKYQQSRREYTVERIREWRRGKISSNYLKIGS